MALPHSRLVDELARRADCAKIFDRSARKCFHLRTRLIKIFGDMTAIAKLVRKKGHNYVALCNINGVRTPGITTLMFH